MTGLQIYNEIQRVDDLVERLREMKAKEDPTDTAFVISRSMLNEISYHLGNYQDMIEGKEWQ